MISNRLILRIFGFFRAFAPVKTGNLRFNATKMEMLNPTQISIYIDKDVAPYAVYTNEPWISPKWRGKRNPNEGWVENGVDYIAQRLAEELGGYVKK